MYRALVVQEYTYSVRSDAVSKQKISYLATNPKARKDHAISSGLQQAAERKQTRDDDLTIVRGDRKFPTAETDTQMVPFASQRATYNSKSGICGLNRTW